MGEIVMDLARRMLWSEDIEEALEVWLDEDDGDDEGDVWLEFEPAAFEIFWRGDGGKVVQDVRCGGVRGSGCSAL